VSHVFDVTRAGRFANVVDHGWQVVSAHLVPAA
jgi:hypothetical protein